MKFIETFDEPFLLDLLPHFLGIAQHDNVNAAPTAAGSLTVLTGRAVTIRRGGSLQLSVASQRMDGTRRRGATL